MTWPSWQAWMALGAVAWLMVPFLIETVARDRARKVERDAHRKALREWGISEDVLVVRRPDPTLPPPPTFAQRQPNWRQ